MLGSDGLWFGLGVAGVCYLLLGVISYYEYPIYERIKRKFGEKTGDIPIESSKRSK